MGNETGYRTLNLDTVKSIKCYGIKANVTPEPIEQTFDLSLTQQDQPNNVLEFAEAS